MVLSPEQLERVVLFVEGLAPLRTPEQLAHHVLLGLDRIVVGDPPRGPGASRAHRREEEVEAEIALLRALRGPLVRAYARVGRPDGAAGEPGADPHVLRLTPRERQVLDLVAGGWTNVAVAHRLGCSPRTVAKHLEHAYRTLEVRNRAEAVAHLERG